MSQPVIKKSFDEEPLEVGDTVAILGKITSLIDSQGVTMDAKVDFGDVRGTGQHLKLDLSSAQLRLVPAEIAAAPKPPHVRKAFDVAAKTQTVGNAGEHSESAAGASHSPSGIIKSLLIAAMMMLPLALGACSQTNKTPVSASPRQTETVQPSNKETTSDRNTYNVNVINAPARDYVPPSDGTQPRRATSSAPALTNGHTGSDGATLASADGRFVQNVTVILTGSSSQNPSGTVSGTGTSSQTSNASPTASPSQTVNPSVSAAAGVALPGGSVSQQPTAANGGGTANPANTTTAVPTNTNIKAPADVLGQLMQTLGVPGQLQSQVLAAIQQQSATSNPPPSTGPAKPPGN